MAIKGEPTTLSGMEVIARYDRVKNVSSALDPVEDLLSWIDGLRSLGYTSDVLRTVHGMTHSAEIRESARLVGLFAKNAGSLANQAFSGMAEMAFLPLYYSILNLSKIMVVAGGLRRDLAVQRYHGASYDPERKRSQSLLTEVITLHPRGVFGLLYKRLTGANWLVTKRDISMGKVYPYVLGTSYEYEQMTGQPAPFQWAPVIFRQEGDSHALRVNLTNLADCSHPKRGVKSYLKIVSGFAEDPNTKGMYVCSIKNAASEADARTALLAGFRRYLLYELPNPSQNYPATMTPISNSQMMLPPEIPIWLCFFHMSSVVRYDPECLQRLSEDRCWPMLLSLRRHAFLGFCVLTWSSFHKTSFHLTG